MAARFKLAGSINNTGQIEDFFRAKTKKTFIDRYTYATNLNNEEGMMRLDYLSELLDNEQLRAELPKEITKKLQEHYHSQGNGMTDKRISYFVICH